MRLMDRSNNYSNILYKFAREHLERQKSLLRFTSPDSSWGQFVGKGNFNGLQYSVLQPMCTIVQIQGHNRARQRDKLGQVLEELSKCSRANLYNIFE